MHTLARSILAASILLAINALAQGGTVDTGTVADAGLPDPNGNVTLGQCADVGGTYNFALCSNPSVQVQAPGQTASYNTLIGGTLTAAGSDNILIGQNISSLQDAGGATADKNVLVGNNIAVNGSKNTALGYAALSSGLQSNNTAVGSEALGGSTGGSSNVALGTRAGYAAKNVTASDIIGANAANSAQTVSASTVIGFQAGNGASNISSSQIIGSAAGMAGTASLSQLIGTNAGQFGSFANSVVMGTNAGQYGSASYSVLIGGGTRIVNGSNDTVVGFSASVGDGATDATAIGVGAKAATNGSTAVGTNTQATGYQSNAFGYFANASGYQSTAVGPWSSDDGRNNVVSIGSSTQDRQLIHVAAGTADLDAVNVAQLKAAIANNPGFAKLGYVVQAGFCGGAGNVSGAFNFSICSDATTIRPGGNTTGNYNTVIGYGNITGESNITLGGNVIVGNPGSGAKQNIAIGDNLSIDPLATSNTIIGQKAFAASLGSYNTVLGGGALSGASTIIDLWGSTGGITAIGASAGNAATAVVDSTLLGYQAGSSATGFSLSEAIGFQAGQLARANQSDLIGTNAGARGAFESAVVIGNGSGTGATTSNSVLVGAVAGSNMTGDFNVAIGQRAGLGVAANKAIMVGQGTYVEAGGDGGISIGYQAHTGWQGVALGAQASGTGSGIAIGGQASAGGGGIAIGGSSNDGGDSSVVSFGNKYLQRRLTNVADGTAQFDAVNLAQLQAAVAGVSNPNTAAYDDATKTTVTFQGVGGTLLSNVARGSVGAGSQDAVNGGQLRDVSASVAGLLGGGATLNADGTVFAVSYGVQGTTYANVGSALGALDAATTANAKEIAGQTVAITGLGGRVVSAESAVASLKGSAGDVALALGGGAAILGDGTFSVPTYMVQGASHHDVGSSLAGLDGAVTITRSEVGKLQTDVAAINTELAGSGIGIVQQTSAGGAITIGANLDGATVNVAGTAGNRTVTGVAAGSLSATSTDAVNGAQLNDTNAQVAAASSAVAGLIAGLTNLQRDALQFDDASGAYSATRSGTDTRIGHLAAGIADADAANVGQLRQATAAAVQYSDTEHTLLSLGNGGTTVRLTNIADGTAPSDAVNRSQLDAVASMVGSGSAMGVGYTDASKARVELGGQNGTLIGNVAAGKAPTDAVNYGQLMAVQQATGYSLNSVGNWLGGGASIGFGTFIPPAYRLQGQTYNSAGDAFAAMDSAINSSNARLAAMENSLAAGSSMGDTGTPAKAKPDTNAVAVGGSSSANGMNATALGSSSYAAGNGDTAVGSQANVAADFSTAVGSNAQIKAVADHSVAVGANTNVSADHAVAIGEGASADAQNAVAIGSGSVASRTNTVSVGAAGAERAITNVATGTATTDAANVGQVDAAVQQAINTANTYTNQQMTNLQSGLNTFARSVDDRFRDVRTQISRSGAMATAMSQMGTASAGATGNGRLAAGVGYQGGKSAVAVGYATQVGEKVHVNFGGAATAGMTTVGAGIGVDL